MRIPKPEFLARVWEWPGIGTDFPVLGIYRGGISFNPFPRTWNNIEMDICFFLAFNPSLFRFHKNNNMEQ